MIAIGKMVTIAKPKPAPNPTPSGGISELVLGAIPASYGKSTADGGADDSAYPRARQ